MRKGSKIPYSFLPGDRVIDNEGKICVVETKGEHNIFMVFDPYIGEIRFDFIHRYRPYSYSLIKTIIKFLKNT
jgi:hypothetical protein